MRVAWINQGPTGRSRGIFLQAKGDHLDWVHSGQKVLKVIRRGRLVLVIGGQESQNKSRDHQVWVHSDQIVLMMARREARVHKGRPTQGLCSLKIKPKGLQTLKWELENNSRQPRDLTKNRQSDSLNWESTYSFSRGLWRGELLLMMMMSANQSSWYQVHVKAFLGTDESLLRTQFR